MQRDWAETAFPGLVFSFIDFLIAGNARMTQPCCNVRGDIALWVGRVWRREQQESGHFFKRQRARTSPPSSILPTLEQLAQALEC